MLLKYFHLSRAYTPHGWQNDIYVAVDDAGEIIYCDTKPEESVDYEFVKDNVIPGFINLHSHAFQYAFAGIHGSAPRRGRFCDAGSVHRFVRHQFRRTPGTDDAWIV